MLYDCIKGHIVTLRGCKTGSKVIWLLWVSFHSPLPNVNSSLSFQRSHGVFELLLSMYRYDF